MSRKPNTRRHKPRPTPVERNYRSNKSRPLTEQEAAAKYLYELKLQGR